MKAPLMVSAFCESTTSIAWAKEHGCPWNIKTCAAAAFGGHLEVLKWAREHGQGLTLVHLSAQLKRFLWDRERI